MKKIAASDSPYFYLWVTTKEFPSDQLVYMDTTLQEMMYSPITYTGRPESNLSGIGSSD